MNLNKTWRLCLSMWRWIAEERKKGNNKGVWPLKVEWLQKHGFEKDSIENDCFFCDYALTHKARIKTENGCPRCPGTKVDRSFFCVGDDYNYHYRPIAFYNKLRALNRKRMKK